MNPRMIVPKLFRRNDRWYVRVQVPKGMQDKLRRKEYWISLKTSDRQEAMRVASHVVDAKRMEITRDFNRKMAIRRTMKEFTEEEFDALFRDAYSYQVTPGLDLVPLFEKSPFDSYIEFADHREKQLEETIARLRVSRGKSTQVDLAMRILQHRNGIEVEVGSKAEADLRKICVESFIEGHRNIIASLRGQAVHANPNPKLVDLATGEAKAFTPLHEMLSRPPVEPPSLTKLVEEFLDNPNKLRTQKTKNSIRGSMQVVIEILGDATSPDEITEADCERVRDLIMQLPPNFRKLPNLRDRPVEEMVRIAKAKGMPKLSPTGVNTYLKWLTTFLNWCQRKGKISRVPTSFSEISVADPERKEHKRLPFTDNQLQTYFHSRVFSDQERTNCVFWVSLIALWNGMRSNEICQLDVADVVEVEGIWGFDITYISTSGDNDKSVKTGASIRLIPIHHKLIDFGFLDFHCSRLPDGKLFADISRGADGYYSSTFSKKSNRYLADVGVHGPKHKFHSFRHNFRDALRRGRVDREIGKALGGWQRGNTDAFDIYGSGFPLEDLAEELGRVDYPKVAWDHLIR